MGIIIYSFILNAGILTKCYKYIIFLEDTMSNCVDENDKTLSELLGNIGLPEPVIPKDFLNLQLK